MSFDKRTLDKMSADKITDDKLTADKLMAWARGSSHYAKLAETRADASWKLACLVFERFCEHECSGDYGGPSEEMIQLSENILGVSLDSVIDGLMARDTSTESP